MTKVRHATVSRSPKHPQMSLPFHETNPPTPVVAETQRAAAVALLRQMLIDVVLTEGRTNTVDHKKETDHE